MIKLSQLPSILFGFLLVSCASLPANAQPDGPGFIVITKNPDDQVDIQYENNTALVDIQSPNGIGSAMFELESGTMPGTMILRLHLRGLEQLRLVSAQDQVSASVSSGAMSAEHQTILASGTETPLRPGHPLWIQIEIVSGQAEQRIPLEAGYFEVKVPQEFLQNAGKTFEIQWIDFYR